MASKLPLIRALLIDISGTLLIGSNTSKESTNAVYERLRTAGLDVRRTELWTSIGALRAVMKEMRLKKPYMLLSRSALEEFEDDPEAQDGQAGANVIDPSSSSTYDAVVVGLAPTLLDYAHLNTAFRILVGEYRPQADSPPRPPLIALHKVRYLEASDHALSLGPGPFVLALEDAARTSATVIGKPTRAFFETVLHDLEHDLGDFAQRAGDPIAPLPPNRWEGIAVIGDDVHADLGQGAIELGLWRVLVQTGKYRPGDENRVDLQPPDQICATFARFVETLLEQRETLP